MKFPICFLFLAMLSLSSAPIGEPQVESNALIEFLNYSQTLIQNGEIQFLCYKQYFKRPEEVGAKHREILADLEVQLREEPLKSKNPEALRKEILREIENQKRYGAFRDSNEWCNFIEVNLVFQPKYAYRMEVISRFEKYPSFRFTHFFGGGGQFYRFLNGTKHLKGIFPIQFHNDRHTGSLEDVELEKPEDAFKFETKIATNLPPLTWVGISADAKVHFTEDDFGMLVYVITCFHETRHLDYKVKTYVRLKDDLPEVFREEVFHKETFPKHDSPFADAEGYSLSEVTLFSDFEWVEALNITIPKVHEKLSFQYWRDNFMDNRTVLIIKEMDFNLDLPTNFFDWDKVDLSDDNGRQKQVR